MFNVLLDRLPDSYKGYLIRTDFRIGMQIITCLKDEELSEEERYSISLNLLYGNSIPQDLELALKGLMWFLNLGEEDDEIIKSNSKQKDIMDFEIDSSRIYSGFMSVLGIDLSKEKMHWFKFRYLLLELIKCHLSNVIEIRTQDTKDMSPKQKTELNRLKKLYSINKKEELERQKEIKQFLDSLEPKK